MTASGRHTGYRSASVIPTDDSPSKPLGLSVKALPPIHRRLGSRRLRVCVAVLGLSVIASLACASDYCTKEQYERDRAFIESAITAGTIVKGPKGLRELDAGPRRLLV